MTTPKIGLIIAAFNEEERIAPVIAAAQATPLIKEIVVISDGSVDRTSEVAQAKGARVIDLPENRGKGCAVQAGIDALEADIYVFSDADIMGITAEHFELLIRPLLADPDLDMTVGKFSGGRIRTDLSQILIPSISGQRALRRGLVKGLPDLAESRFGVEIVITRYAKQVGAKSIEVTLNDLTHVMKEEKLGMIKGFSARLRMYREMARSIRPQKDFPTEDGE